MLTEGSRNGASEADRPQGKPSHFTERSIVLTEAYEIASYALTLFPNWLVNPRGRRAGQALQVETVRRIPQPNRHLPRANGKRRKCKCTCYSYALLHASSFKCGSTYQSTSRDTIRSEDRPEVEAEEDIEAMDEEQGDTGKKRMTKEENNRYSRLMQQANKKQRKQLKKMYRAGASLEQMIQTVSTDFSI